MSYYSLDYSASGQLILSATTDYIIFEYKR
jgi:hypothetical protein